MNAGRSVVVGRFTTVGKCAMMEKFLVTGRIVGAGKFAAVGKSVNTVNFVVTGSIDERFAWEKSVSGGHGGAPDGESAK